MFRTIMHAWSEHEFTTGIVEEFLSMIDISGDMFAYTCKTISQKKSGKKAQERIYNSDQSINLTECEIRRKVLVHLSINNDANIPASLLMISIVKDAERIGDYVKNLFELNSLIKEHDIKTGLFMELITETGGEITRLFSDVKTAFKDSDKVLATQTVQLGNKIASTCQTAIEESMTDKYSSSQAVIVALGARYMKRIARHLTNISTSIINELPNVDYSIKK
jgi:phosphate transport system protein